MPRGGAHGMPPVRHGARVGRRLATVIGLTVIGLTVIGLAAAGVLAASPAHAHAVLRQGEGRLSP